MKATVNIAVFALFVLSSCSSSLYTGIEYDDLYFLPSDRQVAASKSPARKQVTEGTLKANDYYDNIYAADTLISEEYYGALDYDEVMVDQGNNAGSYDYYDDYSYSGRLRRFYGNYFYPYWRDPFYYSWGYPFSGFGYSRYPYYYDMYVYDPYYDYMYGGYYGSYYSGLYGGYYGWNPYYSPYYSPWGGYYSSIRYRNSDNLTAYGRRDRQSVYSSNWNRSVGGTAVSARRDSYLSKAADSEGVRRSASVTAGSVSDVRRTVAGTDIAGAKSGQGTVRSANTTTNGTVTRTPSATRPEYNSVNRSYTPSYNDPRTSTRPSFNNTRVNSGNAATNSGTGTVINRSGNVRSSSPASTGQVRTAPSYNNAGSYSVPSRRSVESGSSYSSGSFSGSRSSSSVGSSYSSGSSSVSSGVSRSSVGSSSSGSSSSGGSSSGSSSSGGGGGSVSGGRR